MQVPGETIHVRLVQRRFDLIQQAERRRLQVLDRKQQRDRGQALLPAGKLHHVLQLLPGRLGNHTDPGFQDILLFHQLQRSLSAAEQIPEGDIIFLTHPFKLFPELGPHAVIQLVYDLPKICSALDQILMLRGQELITLRHFLVLLDRANVDASQCLDLAPDIGKPLLQCCHRAQILPAQLLALDGCQVIFFPQILNALLPALFQLLQLLLQAEGLTVKPRDLPGKLFPAVKK